MGVRQTRLGHWRGGRQRFGAGDASSIIRAGTRMQYEVRYQIAGDEFASIVDAEDAATAARNVQEEHQVGGETFELIQVHLLDDLSDVHADESTLATERN
jgi:hypothetical protein